LGVKPFQNVKPMLILWSIVLSILIQAGTFTPPAGSALNEGEKLKIANEASVESRIKIYRQASERIQKNIEDAVSKDSFQALPADLKMWTSLLSESLNDIQSNLKSKKKSKNLIRFEIQVRKAISNSQSYKIKSPVETHDDFDACLDQAEKIRRQFVDILFKINKQ
jgi:hypothetical protein